MKSPALLILPLMLLISACSSHPAAAPQRSWIKNGSYVLSRAVPSVSTTSGAILGGLMPLPTAMKALPSSSGSVCVFNRATGEVSVQNGGSKIASFKADIPAELPTGVFKVVLKQDSPVWYATDSYFINRHMAIPPVGSKDRMLKGALGSTALFLENGTAIHDSPIHVDDVGGIRLGKTEAIEIAKLLSIGSAIEID